MWPFSNPGVSFTAADIPPLTDKVILVTGGNSGLGKQSVLELARHSPSEIWLAARSPSKAQAAIDEIKATVPSAPIRFLELDLASFDSVKTAARTFLAAQPKPRLDVLILNGGIMMTPAQRTPSGYEHQFGTNHMGHALLTKLLLPTLLATADDGKRDVRVVVLSSAASEMHPAGGIVFESLKTDGSSMAGWTRYGQSKLANILYARALAKRNPALMVTAIHPGAVSTNLMVPLVEKVPLGWALRPVAKVFLNGVAVGALNQLWAAAGRREEMKSGEFYWPVGVAGKGKELGRDDELAGRLWEWTEEELKGQSL